MNRNFALDRALGSPIFLKLVWVAFLLCFCPYAHTQSASRYGGEWVSRHLVQVSVSPKCSYIEVHTFRLTLSPASLNGSLLRTTERTWWSKMDEICRYPDEDPSSPGFNRGDGWMLNGEALQGGQYKINGMSPRCFGRCDKPTELPQYFEATLSLDAGRLTVIQGPKDLFASVNFFAPGVYQADETAAQAEFEQLLKPLLAGNCNEFYVKSLDDSFKLKASADKFCTIGRAMSALIPPVIYEKAGLSYAVSNGQANGALSRLLLTQGDVLVLRYLIVTNEGANVPIGAAMRKQKDGTWKILDLV